MASTSWELVTGAGTRFIDAGRGHREFVDNETFRKEAPAIFERVRLARPGMIGRDELDWDVPRRPPPAPRGQAVDGFRLLCVTTPASPRAGPTTPSTRSGATCGRSRSSSCPTSCAATPAAEARLWRFLAELDLVATVKAGDRPDDEVLPWLLDNGRAGQADGRFDFIWVRPLDVARLLTTRSYDATGRVVFEVVDDQGLAGGPLRARRLAGRRDVRGRPTRPPS